MGAHAKKLTPKDMETPAFKHMERDMWHRTDESTDADWISDPMEPGKATSYAQKLNYWQKQYADYREIDPLDLPFTARRVEIEEGVFVVIISTRRKPKANSGWVDDTALAALAEAPLGINNLSNIPGVWTPPLAQAAQPLATQVTPPTHFATGAVNPGLPPYIDHAEARAQARMNAAKEADRQQRAAETVRRASLSDDEREAEDEAKMLEEAAYQAARQLKRESIALDDAIPFNKPWTCPSCEQEFPCIRGYTTRVDRGTHVERLCLTCAPARLDLLPQIDISQLPPPIDTPAPTSY